MTPRPGNGRIRNLGFGRIRFGRQCPLVKLDTLSFQLDKTKLANATRMSASVQIPDRRKARVYR